MSTKAAVVGAGVIGAGWAARLIENGIDVAIFDPSPDAERRVAEVLANAERAYAALTMIRRPRKGEITHAASIAETVEGADWIVESVPERLDLKRKAYAEIEANTSKQAVIASSTSGILPSELQAELDRPERLLVAHPFNPVYLLPMVEIVGGRQTSPEVIEQAMAFYAGISMKPVRIRKEIEPSSPTGYWKPYGASPCG